MKKTILVLLLLPTVLAARAESSGEPGKRLTVFSNMHTACKVMIVTSPETARSFTVATRRSLTDVCECAALLTVADLSDEKVALLVAGDKATATQSLQPLASNFARCIKLD